MDEIICGESVDDFDLNLIEVDAIKLIIQGYIEGVSAPIGDKYDVLLEDYKRTIGMVVFDEESWEAFDDNTKVWLATSAAAEESYYMTISYAVALLKERESRKLEKSDKDSESKEDKSDNKKVTPKSGSKIKTPEKKIKIESDNIEKEHKSEKIITD